jgi:hypothetical protein
MDDSRAFTLIASTLEAGETVLWWQGAPWGPTLISNGLMSILVVGFVSLFILLGRTSLLDLFRTGSWWRRAGAGLCAAVFAVAVVTVLAQTASSFATAYAVTDRRVLVVAQGPWRIISSYDETTGVTEVEVNGDRIDIVRDARRHGFWKPLFGVRDAPRVAVLIRARVPANHLRFAVASRRSRCAARLNRLSATFHGRTKHEASQREPRFRLNSRPVLRISRAPEDAAPFRRKRMQQAERREVDPLSCLGVWP